MSERGKLSSAFAPGKTINVSAFLIADTINIKKFREEFTAPVHSQTSSELFYAFEDGRVLYIFNYGVAVFANTAEVETTKTLSLLAGYAAGGDSNRLREDFAIHARPVKSGMKLENDCITVPEATLSVIRIILFNLAQSVALDYYCGRSEQVLEEIMGYARQLEARGAIHATKRTMLKFIGKTLNVRNRIVDNLYIFDNPEMVWDDANLDLIHNELTRHFDLRARFRELEYTLNIVHDNLTIFKEIFMHRESNRLEIIIIILILIEVIDMFFVKIFR